MSASTAVRSVRERSISPSNIAFILQRPKTIQVGKIQAQNPSTTRDVFKPKDLSTVDVTFELLIHLNPFMSKKMEFVRRKARVKYVFGLLPG